MKSRKGRQTSRRAANTVVTSTNARRYRKLVMSLAVVVVFVTAYMLVLPAVTLDNDTADQTPGIDTNTSVQTVQEDAQGGDESMQEKTEPVVSDAEESGKHHKSENAVSNDRKEESHAKKANDDQDSGSGISDAEEVKLLSEKKKIEFKANGYKIVCECGADTKLPADVKLKVKEVKKAEDVSDSDIEESKVTGESGREYTFDDLEKKAGETVDIGENAQIKLLDISFRSDDMTAAGEEGGPRGLRGGGRGREGLHPQPGGADGSLRGVMRRSFRNRQMPRSFMHRQMLY
jgi:hypothetical protein